MSFLCRGHAAISVVTPSLCRGHATVSRRRNSVILAGEGEKERRRGKGKSTDTDREHSRSCTNGSRDHNRLLVPMSKQALSRCLHVQHKQKNLPNGQTHWSVLQDGSNETRKKKRVHLEILALRENAVTQEYRLNVSVSTVCPYASLTRSTASFSGQKVPVFGVTGAVRPVPRSRCRGLHGKSGAVDVTPDMCSKLTKP